MSHVRTLNRRTLRRKGNGETILINAWNGILYAWKVRPNRRLPRRWERKEWDDEVGECNSRHPIHIRDRSSTLPTLIRYFCLSKMPREDRRPSRCPNNQTRRPPRPVRSSWTRCKSCSGLLGTVCASSASFPSIWKKISVQETVAKGVRRTCFGKEIFKLLPSIEDKLRNDLFN